ncbi:hypothetical protein AVEN_257976-1 [Araneus ventricosus]|uniref:Uncharacterized protein n=1 Tax=Araneus ventricosus TaxID=182803 RepID=A0A4Y2K5N4_ARAVE|nr:hypothetical protein AVEN_257976-1 [Araneus ventricosus]
MPRHCVDTLRGIVKCRANSTTTAIKCLYTVTGSSLLVDRRHHKEGGSDLHGITIQDAAMMPQDTWARRGTHSVRSQTGPSVHLDPSS